MTAAVWKMIIEQGATFKLAVAVLDDSGQYVTLDGYTARIQIRASAGAPDPPLADWSTSNEIITTDQSGQRFTITVPGSVTAAYTWDHGVYDMLIVAPDGSEDRLLKGEAEVSMAVTLQ